MTQVKDGIVQTVMQTTLVWLLLPIAWNKTDTSFIMSDLFCGQGWNRSDSPVYNTYLATLPIVWNKTDNSVLTSFLICLLSFSSPKKFQKYFS